VKDVLLEPAGTATDDGSVISRVLADSETSAPPLGAALLRLTVQFAVALDPRLDGVQPTDESETALTRLRAATLETPLNVAVTVAV
jgi:hypothetical protein